MSSSSSYSWMPGWLRKFLHFDDEMPNYEPSAAYYDEEPRRSSSSSAYNSSYSSSSSSTYSSSSSSAYSYTPPARPTTGSYDPAAVTSYTPPALPPAAYGQAQPSEEAGVSRFAPLTYPGAQTSEEAVKRFSSYSSAPPSSASPVDESGRPVGPPPLTPRVANTNVNAQGMTVPGPISQAAANGFVQPVGYAVRSFARGALPPQGIEQFSRELRATMTDVWNFYSYWIRFETEDLVHMGREAIDAVTGLLPPLGEEVSRGTQPRRINVSQGTNGEGNGGTRRAVPPAPPAPTAVFSPVVTADDAVIPPTGKDTTSEFASRMASETEPVAKDVAEAAKKVADAVKSDVPSTPPAPPAASSAPVTPPAPPAASSAPVTPPAPPAASSAPVTPPPPSTPAKTPPAPPAAPGGAQSKDKGQGNKGKR